MRTLIVLALVTLTGCSTLDNHSRVGYRDYDPCIRCGEGWTFLPNEVLPVK